MTQSLSKKSCSIVSHCCTAVLLGVFLPVGFTNLIRCMQNGQGLIKALAIFKLNTSHVLRVIERVFANYW